MIEASRPDIIVVTGDITSEDENMRAFRTFGEFMESFNIPWGFVYGNHDAETRRTHTENTAFGIPGVAGILHFLTAVQRM